MNKLNEIYAQGDVLLAKVDGLPADAKPIKGATLALGEKTGHHHSFYDTDTMDAPKSFDPVAQGLGSKNVLMYVAGAETFAQILEPVYLKHQEHKSFKIEPGTYKVGIVQEYDYEKAEARKVVD
jgi:hypothetical protein